MSKLLGGGFLVGQSFALWFLVLWLLCWDAIRNTGLDTAFRLAELKLTAGPLCTPALFIPNRGVPLPSASARHPSGPWDDHNARLNLFSPSRGSRPGSPWEECRVMGCVEEHRSGSASLASEQMACRKPIDNNRGLTCKEEGGWLETRR